VLHQLKYPNYILVAGKLQLHIIIEYNLFNIQLISYTNRLLLQPITNGNSKMKCYVFVGHCKDHVLRKPMALKY